MSRAELRAQTTFCSRWTAQLATTVSMKIPSPPGLGARVDDPPPSIDNTEMRDTSIERGDLPKAA